MNRFLLPLALLSLLYGSTGAMPVLAHDGEPHHAHPPLANAAEVYRPTVLPDRVNLSWVGDPTTTQAVTWRTSTEVRTGLAEIAVATSGPEFKTMATQYTATSQALLTDLSTAHYHTVNFEKLTPGTKYCYRVGDGGNWSEWYQFTTAKSEPEAFSFIYFGDAQNDLRSLWSRVIREAYRDAPKAKFMIHAGDLVNSAERDEEWGEWFGAGGWLNGMVPSMSTPGNHEQVKLPDGTRRQSKHWRPQFALPENGIVGLEEACYTFVYQNTRFISLDSNRMHAEQAVWLDKVLAENKLPWVVCSFHHPIFSTAKDRDNAVLRAAWKPVFDKYRVDLVLQGHDHSYGRTGLKTPVVVPETVGNVPTGVTNVDTETGTIYVVSVSGPKMYNLQSNPVMTRVAEDTQLYQIIEIAGDRLRYEARTATGELYDAFTLTKAPGKTNVLEEQMPLMPERRRPPMPASAPSNPETITVPQPAGKPAPTTAP